MFDRLCPVALALVLALSTWPRVAIGGTPGPDALPAAGAGLPSDGAINDPTTLDLQARIDEALAAGRDKLVVPAGVYRIDRHPITLAGVTNFVLDAPGATFLFASLQPGWQLKRCRNVTLRGFTMDYDPLPFTQGTVLAVAADFKSFEFETHEGYRDLREPWSGNFGFLFDPATRSWLADAPDLYCTAVEAITPRRGRFVMSPWVPQAALERCLRPGALLVLGQRHSHGIVISDLSRDITVEDVTIHTAPGIAIMGRFCLEGHRFRRITIAPGPRPPGATEDRLLATTADAINYAYSRGDITVASCNFSFVADDMLNLHGMLFAAMKCDSATSFLTARPFGLESFSQVVPPGSTVRFLGESNYAILGTGVLERIETVADGALTRTEAAKFMPRQSARRILRDSGRYTVYRLVLRQPHGLRPGEGADIPALNCSHYLVASNTFRHCRGSVKLMASHGRVTHNRLEDIQALGIIAGAYYSQWGEAGWVEDLTIASNSLQRIGLGDYAHSKRCFSPGAIAIFGTVAEKFRGPYAAFNRAIRIADNRIAGCSVCGIHIYAARDVVVSGNRITDVNRAPDQDVGAAWRLVATEPIQVHPDAEATVLPPADD